MLEPQRQANFQLESRHQLVSLPWMNSEPSGRRLRRIAKTMLLWSRRQTWTESKMPPLSRPRTRLFKKRDSLTSRKQLPWLSRRPRKKKWSRWIRLEPRKSILLNSRSTNLLKMKLCYLKLRRLLIMTSMMSSKWTRWFFIQKLLLSVISSSRKIKDLNKNGLKSRKSLT